jgi:putative transposase
MPRRARVLVAGVPVHVIQRGVNRAACFFADDDYALYLDTLAGIAAAEGIAVHAYVLMTNHVHLLATPQTPGGLSTLMKRLGQRYVQTVNRVYRRTGTLWEGRYRSCLVEAERYLLTCQRYIELNPVRAAMVALPQDYRWSSYAGNAGVADDPAVTPHHLYLCLGRDAQERQDAYRRLFTEDIDAQTLERIRDSTNGGFVLGNDRFQRTIAAMLGRRTWKGVPGRPRKPLDDGAQRVLAS